MKQKMDDPVGALSPTDLENGILSFQPDQPNPPAVTTTLRLLLHFPSLERSAEKLNQSSLHIFSGYDYFFSVISLTYSSGCAFYGISDANKNLWKAFSGRQYGSQIISSA